VKENKQFADFSGTYPAAAAFWAERGCVLQQPYDVEVGAGTMAPETFLRVLGPKPYKVAYVQPSRRPADGRYGENPNRLFKHMQLQVDFEAPAGEHTGVVSGIAGRDWHRSAPARYQVRGR